MSDLTPSDADLPDLPELPDAGPVGSLPPLAAPQLPPVTVASPAPAPTTPIPARRGLGLLGTVLVAAVVAMVVGAFAGLAGYAVGRSVDRHQAAAPAAPAPAAPAPAGAASGSATGSTAESVADIAARTLPEVVSILVEGGDQSGSGSGFVIRPDGYILTNNHVASLAGTNGKLTVAFNDGTSLPGKVVGTNKSYDLAVVKVERTGLAPVTMGDSSLVHVGDEAVAIGAPLGLDGTVTSGIVSAVDRPVTAGDNAADASFINAIQTDAAINPGNSGGPLLNAVGEVIGVNSAIATLAIGGESGNIGLGFAIPSNSAKRIADEIIATGHSRTPLMGVQLDKTYTGKGAKVADVTADSAADHAGLRVGDIITKVDARTIDDDTELVVTVRSYSPGDSIEVTYQRSGQDRTTTLTLGADTSGQ